MKSNYKNITIKSLLQRIKITASKITGNLFALLITVLIIIGYPISDYYRYFSFRPQPTGLTLPPPTIGKLAVRELNKKITKIC